MQQFLGQYFPLRNLERLSKSIQDGFRSLHENFTVEIQTSTDNMLADVLRLLSLSKYKNGKFIQLGFCVSLYLFPNSY